MDDKDVGREVLENWTKCHDYIFNLASYRYLLFVNLVQVEPEISKQHVKLEPIKVEGFEQDYIEFEKQLTRVRNFRLRFISQ